MSVITSHVGFMYLLSFVMILIFDSFNSDYSSYTFTKL